MGHWAQVMRDKADSGLTAKDYCEREGISANRYSYWKRKLRMDAQAVAPQGWAIVRTPNDDAVHIIVEVSGCRIVVSRETDTVLLTKICNALKNL